MQKGYAYLANCIYFADANVTLPSNPFIAGVDSSGRCDSTVLGECRSVGLSRHYAYATDALDCLLTYNISVPESPHLVSCYELHGQPWDLKVSDSYLYIATLDSGLQIFNIADPAAPQFVHRIDIPDFASSVFISGHYAIVGCWDPGLMIFDITDPANPVLSATYDSMYSSSRDIYVSGQYIYIANGVLTILRYAPLAIDSAVILPSQIYLSQNYPNPFNAQTTIAYSLPKSLEVSIDIYDILGRKVTSLAQGIQDAGEHNVTWDASDTPSGVYIARLNTSGQTRHVKMVILQ